MTERVAAERNQLKARVRVEAARRGWKLADVARACGRSPQWLNDMLSRSNPKLETLTLLAGAFGCDIGRLLRPVNSEEYGRIMMRQ